MMPNIDVINNYNFLSYTVTSDDLLEKIIDKYENYVSIICIYIYKQMTNSELILHFNLLQKIRVAN